MNHANADDVGQCEGMEVEGYRAMSVLNTNVMTLDPR